MKENSDILQYHIDKNYKRLRPEFASKLTAAQRESLQKQLNLHYSLMAIRVKKSRGYASLQASLDAIRAGATPKPFFVRFRMQLAAVSMAALLLVAVMGFGTIQGGGNSNTGILKKSNLQANGTIDNLDNLNLADAGIDLENTAADSSAVSSAKTELTSTTNLDGVVNENF